MASLSISVLCKKNGLTTSSVIEWLKKEGYVTGFKTATEKGLQSGISVTTGNDGGVWLVYDEHIQQLIKSATLSQSKNTPFYTLTDLSKKVKTTRADLVKWLIQERYILSTSAITTKGEELGFFTKQTPYNTIIYGTEKTIQFLETESKENRIILKHGPEKEKSKPPLLQNPTELNPEEFIIVDTETTGFSNNDEVVELGILSGTGKELYNSLFCPTIPMNSSAKEVTGITSKMLKTAPRFKEEWPNILKLIKGKIIVGHNVNFDKRLIQTTINRYGIDYSLDENHDFIDSMAVAKQEVPGENSYKLQSLCKSLGIEGVQTHRAVDDCKMTLKMLQTIKEQKENALIF